MIFDCSKKGNLMSALFAAAVALFVGYVWGRQNAREQVFRQVRGMHFLTEQQKDLVSNHLIHRSGQ